MQIFCAGRGLRFWSGTRPFRPLVAVLGLATMLAACEPASIPQPAPSSEPAIPTADAETQAAQDYYRNIEANYLAQGLLRQDGGGPDTPFDARALSQNFLNIAFFDEFSERGGKLVPGGAQQVLHRWDIPIRLQLDFGASVPADEQAADRATVSAYLARLSRLTHLPAQMVSDRPNYLVLVLGPTERRAARARILGFSPGTSKPALESALHMTPDIYCTVFSYSDNGSPRYTSALAVIRSELPALSRKACYHEELAQGLGLVNDSPKARPSIFNDDQEFALLTRQDALMLRILYDKRLRPGMTLDEARPIVETVAAELLPDRS